MLLYILYALEQQAPLSAPQNQHLNYTVQRITQSSKNLILQSFIFIWALK